MGSDLVMIKVDTTGLEPWPSTERRRRWDGRKAFRDDMKSRGWTRRGYVAGDEVLSVSIVDGDGDVLLDTYVKPLYARCWPDAEKVNRISPETVADAPAFASIAEEVRDIVQEADTVAGWNLWFELASLDYSAELAKKKTVEVDRARQRSIIDEFAEAWAEVPEWALWDGDYTLKSLPFALRAYGLESCEVEDGGTRSLALARDALAVMDALDAGRPFRIHR